MDHSTRAEFERCAIVSGLLTEQQLAEAISGMRWASGDEPDDEPSAGDVSESERLAAHLVETDCLNPWQAKQLLEGQTRFHLGPYRIVDSLGSGGMGQVFRALHTVSGQEVAVKVLPRDKSTPEAVASFGREIKAQASLDHENLVQAVDAGYDGKVYYLVSEYVAGSDLRQLVRQAGPLDMQAAACIISQVAKGLGHAHHRGLIHRDVKPGNVLVTPDGRAKLSDLGLAGPLGDDAGSDPRRGKIVGTPDYLSPDHIKTPWAPAPTWDIYSLGCTLYYAVTSKVPFPGGSTSDKARAHCQMRPLDPRRLNSSLSAKFVDVLADMMAKEPADRIKSAQQVVERLAPWCGEPVPIPAAAVKAASDALQAPPGATTFVVPAGPNRPIASAEHPQNMADTADGLPQLSALSDVPPMDHARIDDDTGGGHTDDDAQASQTTHPIASGDESTFSEFTIGNAGPSRDERRARTGHTAIFRPLSIFANDRFRTILLFVLAPLAIAGIVLSAWNLISRLF